MNDSIRLHPQFGLNPMICQCFWCGKNKNEIALLGAAYNKEAPMHGVTDYEPCEECADQFNQGMLLMEAADSIKGPIPTGRHWVITEDATKRIFTGDMLKQVLLHHKAFIDKETALHIGLPY